MKPQHPGTLSDYPGLYGAGLPYHSNGVIFEILIVKCVQKIFMGTLLNEFLYMPEADPWLVTAIVAE